jgi:hypothetical protein
MREAPISKSQLQSWRASMIFTSISPVSRATDATGGSPTAAKRHGYPLLLAGIEMVFWGLTEALQTAFYRVFCRAVYRQLEIL